MREVGPRLCLIESQTSANILQILQLIAIELKKFETDIFITKYAFYCNFYFIELLYVNYYYLYISYIYLFLLKFYNYIFQQNFDFIFVIIL